MGFEIERRFLVRGKDWRRLATGQTTIRQAYLAPGKKASVRVRISDSRTATLTVKSSPPQLRRLELEYAIPTLEAEALIALREGSIIEKTRYQVPHGRSDMGGGCVLGGEPRPCHCRNRAAP
jgi:adenylate cyclase